MRDLTMHELDSQLAEQLPARELMTVMRPTYKPPANQWAASSANGGNGGNGGFNAQLVNVSPQVNVGLFHSANGNSNTSGGANGGPGGNGGIALAGNR